MASLEASAVEDLGGDPVNTRSTTTTVEGKGRLLGCLDAVAAGSSSWKPCNQRFPDSNGYLAVHGYYMLKDVNEDP